MADTPSLMRIGLNYQDLESFAAAAAITFAKGRMTVRSKRDLKVGQRLTLAVIIPGLAPIDIICEIIQQIPARNEADYHVFALRWLNFTEKKLGRLTGTVAAPLEPMPDMPLQSAPPAPAPAAPVKPPAATAKPAPAARPAPASKPAPAPAARPPAGASTVDPADAGEEYMIDLDAAEGSYPSFFDPASVIVPDAPEPGAGK